MKVRNGYTMAASIILGITAFYWLIQGILGVLAQGNSGILFQALIPAVIMIALLYLAWRRLLLGGILIATYGIIMAVYFFMVKLDLYQALYFLLPMCVPLVVSGLLFIEAEWKVRKSTA